MYLQAKLNGNNIRITQTDISNGEVYLTYLMDSSSELKSIKKPIEDISTILANNVVIDVNSDLVYNIEGLLNGNQINLINSKIENSYLFIVYVDVFQNLRTLRKQIQSVDNVLLIDASYLLSGTDTVLSGSGAANQVAIWSGYNTLSGSDLLSFTENGLSAASDIWVTGSNQNYRFTKSGNSFALQGMESGKTSVLQMYGSDDPATGNVALRIYQRGSPTQLVNYSFIYFTWQESTSAWQLATASNGDGQDFPIQINTKGNSEQVYLQTNGNVGINKIPTSATLDVNGSLAVSTILNESTDTNAFLVSASGGVVKYRTGDQVLSDIGAASATHNHDHATLTNLNSSSYYHITSAYYTDLTDGGDSSLHYHSSDRALSAATGVLSVSAGGTGQSTYTNGQILIGNTTGNTLSKNTITGTTNRVTVTNGAGTITLTTPQNTHTAATPQFARMGLGVAADNTASLKLTTIPSVSSDTDTFLVSNSGIVGYRTGVQVLSDIGGLSGTGASNYVALWTGNSGLSGSSNLTFNGSTLLLTGLLGINTSAVSTTLIHGIGDGIATGLRLTRYTNNAIQVAMVFQKSRGSLSSPIVVNNDDSVVTFTGQAWDGVDFQNVAQMAFEIDGTASAGDMPGRIIFNVTPDGGSTLAEAMRISQDKTVGIGKTASLATLDVNGSLALATVADDGDSEASVLVRTSTGLIKSNEIDTRCWGTSLVDFAGTPVNNQVAVFTDQNTIEGDSDLTWDGATLTINNTLSASYVDVTTQLRLTMGSQAYYIYDRSNALAIVGQSSATETLIDLYAADGDGTDNVEMNIYGVGSVIDFDNRERLIVGYNYATPTFRITSEANGSGTLRPIAIYTGIYDSQLVLATDGTVGILKSPSLATLDVNGNLYLNGPLSATSNSYIYGDGSLVFGVTSGGSGAGVLYVDSGGTTRRALTFDNNTTILSNRASNGIVHVRANTSTAGVNGEVTVMVIEDTGVGILKSPSLATLDVHGSLGIYTSGSGVSGAMIDTWHDSASPAANDIVFYLKAYGESSTSVKRMYGSMKWEIEKTNNGVEVGRWKLTCIGDGSDILLIDACTDYTYGYVRFPLGIGFPDDIPITLGLSADSTISWDNSNNELDITVVSNSGGVHITAEDYLKVDASIIWKEVINNIDSPTLTADVVGVHDVRWNATASQHAAIILSNPTEGQEVHMFNDTGTAYTLTLEAGTDPADGAVVSDGEFIILRYRNGKWWQVGY